MNISIRNSLFVCLLLSGSPAAAADAGHGAPVLLDCESVHEGIRSRLELTEKVATLTIQPPDGKSYVCTAPPRITDGRKAVNPHYAASFRLARCVPALPAAIAGSVRAEVEYRLTQFDGKSTLAWIAQSAAKDCAVKVNDLETFFSAAANR